MPIEVLGFTNPTWLAKRHNLNLWQVQDVSQQTHFLLQVSRFGTAWPVWLCALESADVMILRTRTGKPILQLRATDPKEAIMVVENAVIQLRNQRAKLAFYVGHGWVAR